MRQHRRPPAGGPRPTRAILGAALVAGALLVGTALAPGQADAQLLRVGGNNPIEVSATESLEWRQEEQTYVARGDAQVIQGANSLSAQTITAFFTDAGGASPSITRVVAEGGVRIVYGEDRAFAARAVYDIATGRMTLTGNPRIESVEGTISAGETIEYREHERLALATGGAVVVRGEDRLEAQRIEAELIEGEDSGLAPRLVRALGDVVITSPQGRATAAEGTYVFDTQIATMAGGVTVTQGQTHLTGNAAEINLATGVSRMLAGQGGEGRVRGLLVPQ